MGSSKQDTFIQFIQENEGIVYKVVGLYADSATDRQDLKQEILLQSWKAYERFRGDAKFSTWLYKISLNTALTYRKTVAKQDAIKENFPKGEVGTRLENEQQEMLYALVKKLDKIDRMLMTLHLDGYGNKEISSITGMTQNNVNVKIHRLKKQIINEFKKH